MKIFSNLKFLLSTSNLILRMSKFSTTTTISSSIASESTPFKIIDINTLNTNDTYNIFSYGSNSISQLRGRCHNNSLNSQPAFVNNIIRIFVLNGWSNGGVASLHPCNNHKTLGSLVSMTLDDLKQLNKYEELNYHLCEISANKMIDNSKVTSLTYIAKNPKFSKIPSEEYCVAIYKHLQENNHVCNSLNIYGYIPEKNIIEKIKEWTHPGLSNLSIPALFVEVNVERIKRNSSPWIMPKTIYEIENLLDRININTVDDLQVAIHQGTLNQLCIENNLTPFDDTTIAILQSFFVNSVVNNNSLSFNKKDIHYCFVYGSLLKDLSNHYLLKNQSTTEFIGKGITINKYYLTGRIKKEFPYLTSIPLLKNQNNINIHGEVYSVDNECLYYLDRLENHPNWYVRELIQIKLENDTIIEANAYFLRKESDLDRIKNNPDLFENVITGNWRTWGGI